MIFLVFGIDYCFISSFFWDVMLVYVFMVNWGWNFYVKKFVVWNEVKYILSDN